MYIYVYIHLSLFIFLYLCHVKAKSYASFCFFYYDVIFDKLSNLGQIPCVIPYYIEIKRLLISGRVFRKSS